MDLFTMALDASVIFPNGWLDLVMWATVPLLVWTFWTPSKSEWYWRLSIVVSLAWCIFNAHVKLYHGAVMNLFIVTALILGYRRYARTKKV